MTSTKLVGHIKSIFRYPIKSMQGESLNQVELTPTGLLGDRAFALRKPDGRVATAKRTTALLSYHARYETDSIVIELPSGKTLNADDPTASAQLSSHLDMPVALEQWHADQQNFGELDASTIFADVPAEIALEGKRRQLEKDAIRYDLAPGTFYDSAHLHLLTTGTLRHLDQLLNGQSNLDVHRFRPNLFIESVPGLTGFEEDEWVDAQLLVGEEVIIGDIWPTLRCVMTTLPQRQLPKDTQILRTIVQQHANHLGVFANATQFGTVTIGDAVRLVK